MRVKGIASKEQRVAETSRVCVRGNGGWLFRHAVDALRQPCETSGKTLFFAFIYNSIGVPIARDFSTLCSD